MRTIDADLQLKSREEILEEVMMLRNGIRSEATAGCASALWALLPEKAPPLSARYRGISYRA